MRRGAVYESGDAPSQAVGVGVDKLDISVLRSMFTDVHYYPARAEIRESVSSLARKLHVSEPTLRTRLRGYVESGFLKGWGVFVNPNLVGEHVAQVHLDVVSPSSKDAAIKQIKLVDGVWYVAKYHGTALAIGLYYEDEDSLRKRVELMTRIANSEQVRVGSLLFPPCPYRLTPTDVSIIANIQEEPGRVYSSIAKETRRSTRTVRRRLNRMIREGALFVAPILDFRKVRGMIVADIFVFYLNRAWSSGTAQRVLSLVDRAVIAVIPGCPDHLYLSVMLENLAEADEILGKLKRLEGVKDAYVDLVEEHLQQYHAFREQIGRLAESYLPRPSTRSRGRRDRGKGTRS